MKRLMTLCALVVAWLVSSGSAVAQKKSAQAGIPVPQKTEQARNPVPIDAEFTEALEDWRMLQGEIARIEKAEGTVEVPVSIEKLRARAQVKMARLQKWIKDHGVEGWSYNSRLSRFEAMEEKGAQAGMPVPPKPGGKP